MPQRFLRPGITTSERWNSLSWDAQSLFVRLLTLVDDYGRFDGRPSVLHGACFAVWNELHPDALVSCEQTAALCCQLASKKLVEFYVSSEASGAKKVLQIVQWQERARSESKWPGPNDSKPLRFDSNVTANRSVPLPPSPSPSPSPSPITQPDEPAVIGSPNGLPIESPITTPIGKPDVNPVNPVNTTPRRFKPPSVEEVKLHAEKIGLPESQALQFWNYYESNGWRVGKNGMKSWVGSIAGWKVRWEEGGRQGNGSHQQPAKQRTTWELTKQVEAIEEQMSKLRMHGGFEASIGFHWTDENDKASWFELKHQRDEVRAAIAKG